MNPIDERKLLLTRRHFFGLAGMGLGRAALASLLARDVEADALPGLPHFKPRAKRVIYLFQHGAPSQMDLFDYKPGLARFRGNDLPDSVRMGQRLTGMTAYQEKFPTAPSIFKFERHGQCGMWLSDLIPHTARVADEISLIRSLHTEAINHDPAVTFFQTGFQLAGRPSIGSWISYGLGSENQSLPAFVVMVSQGTGGTQALADRTWGSGFLPTVHQGVRFRAGANPVLYLSNPDGYSEQARRRFLDDLTRLNELKFKDYQDPEITTRIAQYEMAFRMQVSVPDLTGLSTEPESVFEMYGPDSRKPGTYAANCVLARRLAERGVRFIQLFHRGWDQHSNLPREIRGQCEQTDQPTWALIQDLKRRGMLEDTLVVWGGEFGRTVYSQGTLTEDNYGRDHHPRCFAVWLAGGGIKGGLTYGETDDFSYNIVKDPVDVHDLHATILHCLGVD
ncbi:MAG: sulfatase, partial [Acidobacteria bacterium]